MHRYLTDLDDSDRWHRVRFRPGDVVVSTRAKSGTTWVQHIVATMLHGSPDLPAPLSELSPWVDWRGDPVERVLARLEAQPGRRVMKTHTPLDGVVMDLRAHYVVVVRSPIDAVVSHYHQRSNISFEQLPDFADPSAPWHDPYPELPVFLRRWAADVPDPREHRDALPGIVYHACEAWMRQRTQPVVLVRYEDLVADREAQMRRLASRLQIDVDEPAWPALVEGAGFEAMKAAAERSAPLLNGLLREPRDFFRRGRPGAGQEEVDAATSAHYECRVRELVTAWVPTSEVEPLCAVLGVGG